MVTIQRQAVLPAPPQQVWDVATPLDGWPQWLSLHVRWPVPPPDDVEAGTEFRQVVSLVGLPIPMKWTVTDYEAPRLFAMTGAAIAGVKVTIRFVIDDDPAGSARPSSPSWTVRWCRAPSRGRCSRSPTRSWRRARPRSPSCSGRPDSTSC